MNIPKHVLNCPWVGQQHDILSFCEHLILRLWSIFSQNDNSAQYCKDYGNQCSDNQGLAVLNMIFS